MALNSDDCMMTRMQETLLDFHFMVDLDSRISLVGSNGARKSTQLKLMTEDLVSLDRMVRRHNHLRIVQFHQHLAEKLDLEISALQYLMMEYLGNEEERMRAAIGRFGLTAWRQPHMLLLDEPTNHLDIETIDSLAEVLNEAGEWKDRTTVEDMDLVVHASLKGWKFVYVGSLKVKNELPNTFKAYRYQQHRWPCGPANLLRKMVMETIKNKKVNLWKKVHVIYSFSSSPEKL